MKQPKSGLCPGLTSSQSEKISENIPFIVLGQKISRYSPHSPTSCLLLHNPATFFVLEQKGQEGKEKFLKKKTKNKPTNKKPKQKEGGGDWESSVLFRGCQRETP